MPGPNINRHTPSVHTRSTEPLGKSDHVAIVGYMQTSLGSDASDSRQIWCWSKANTNDLRHEVSSRNWTDILDAEDVTIAWQTWKARLLEIAKQHIPRRFVKGLVDINSRFSRFQFSAFWSNGLASSSVFIFAPIFLRFFLLSSSMQGLQYAVTDFLISTYEKSYASSKPTR